MTRDEVLGGGTSVPEVVGKVPAISTYLAYHISIKYLY